MDSGDQPVLRDHAVYREFARLYRIARALRPTDVARWNGELSATHRAAWGSVNPATGAISLSAQHVLPYLTGSTSQTHPGEQAEALATVLHEATHSGMELKAPSEPNAVYSEHSKGLMEGVAELRAMVDFDAFADRAGYKDLVLPGPQYPGAHAAADGLLDQASGPNIDRKRLMSQLVTGPVVMHFDQLAGGVVRNRLWDAIPHHPDHQRAARAALIRPMLHAAWPEIPDHSARIGTRIADEIRGSLNAKVDEIRRYYRLGGRAPFGGEPAAREVGQGSAGLEVRTQAGAGTDGIDALRFLAAQAPAAGAVARRPAPGQGARRTGATAASGPAHTASPSGPPDRTRE